MPTQAVQHIRRMRGGAQSHLMRCADSNYYVVKFRNNPQHTRVPVDDRLGTRLAEMIGLPVPVPGELISALRKQAESHFRDAPVSS